MAITGTGCTKSIGLVDLAKEAKASAKDLRQLVHDTVRTIPEEPSVGKQSAPRILNPLEEVIQDLKEIIDTCEATRKEFQAEVALKL